MRDYSRIVASFPLNVTAARVMSRGEVYVPGKKITCTHLETPLPTKPVPKIMPNMTGVKFGRFTVIGLCEEGHGLWLVRCDCGRYEQRKTRAVRNPSNHVDCCQECRQLAYLRRTNKWKSRTGRETQVSEFIERNRDKMMP